MVPVVQIVGYKNSGKTTLIIRLLEIFNAMNYKVAVIKHDVHGFAGDQEGTDTFRYRESGAAATAITSPWRTAIVEERETALRELIITRFQDYDLILIEGFKREMYPKILLLRNREDETLLQELSEIRAVVRREEAESEELSADSGFDQAPAACVHTPPGFSALPCFRSANVRDIAEYIIHSVI